MCGSWGKRKPSWKPGGPARQEREKAGSWLQTVEEDRQWRRIDVAGWPKTQETGSSHLQETFMHRVSVIVHCVAVIYMTITGIVFHCIICFRKINNLVPNTICIHPLMYGKLCRAQSRSSLLFLPGHDQKLFLLFLQICSYCVGCHAEASVTVKILRILLLPFLESYFP